MVSCSLYLKDNYINPNINYIISGTIREYDIQKANVNILFAKGLLTREQANYYLSLPGSQRKILLGILQRDNEDIKNGLKEGFIEYRKRFFEANNINEMDVLAIKKDALFIINRELDQLTFDNVNFIPKSIYTSYYRIDKLELFYYNNHMGIEVLDIKGISDNRLELHSSYLIDFLKFIFDQATITSIDNVIGYMSTFTQQYLNGELELGYYREFNPRSQFKILSGPYMSYYAEYLPEEQKGIVCKDYNHKFLYNLFSYYSSIYNNVFRRCR